MPGVQASIRIIRIIDPTHLREPGCGCRLAARRELHSLRAGEMIRPALCRTYHRRRGKQLEVVARDIPTPAQVDYDAKRQPLLVPVLRVYALPLAK
jgi:hypothetical protein